MSFDTKLPFTAAALTLLASSMATARGVLVTITPPASEMASNNVFVDTRTGQEAIRTINPINVVDNSGSFPDTPGFGFISGLIHNNPSVNSRLSFDAEFVGPRTIKTVYGYSDYFLVDGTHEYDFVDVTFLNGAAHLNFDGGSELGIRDGLISAGLTYGYTSTRIVDPNHNNAVIFDQSGPLLQASFSTRGVGDSSFDSSLVDFHTDLSSRTSGYFFLSTSFNSSLNHLKLGASSGTYYTALDILYAEAAVPEPSTWTLMIGGFGFVGLAARRRSAQLIYTCVKAATTEPSA